MDYDQISAIIGLIFVFVVFTTCSILDSPWRQRRVALKKPFGEQRVQILEKMWHLEHLLMKRGDPSGAIRGAIVECETNLNKIDQAVVALSDDQEIKDVNEQCQIADLILQTCREDLDKFRPRWRATQDTSTSAPQPSPILENQR